MSDALRRWWNRLLVRFGRVDPYWRRGSFDRATGWHSDYRLRRGRAPVNDDGAWIETRRWYGPQPTRVIDTAADYRTTTVEPYEIGGNAKWPRALTDSEIQRAHDEMWP